MKPLALVDFPSPPFQQQAIAVCEYLNKKGIDVFLTSLHDCPHLCQIVIEESENIKGFVKFKDLNDDFIKTFNLIYLHNDNSFEQANHYKKAHPTSRMIGYADGWRNAYAKQDKLIDYKFDGIHYFGIEHHSTKSNLLDFYYEIGDLDSYSKAVEKLTNAFNSVFQTEEKILDLEIEGLFCARYWGKDGYSFEQESVIKSWIDTIKTFHEGGLLIIKTQKGRYEENIMKAFLEKLKSENINHKTLEALLLEKGINSAIADYPVEYLILSNKIPTPKTIYSLDSSIPSLLHASLPSEKVCETMILGSKNCTELFKENPGYGTIVTNLKQQEHSLKNLDLTNPIKVEKIKESELYKVSKL